jgi:membrane carboxypeptidase/penicillin-binding protein
MLTLVRIVVGCVLLGLLCVAGLMGWLYFSHSGLPDITELNAYAPAASGMARPTSCIDELPISSANDLRPVLPALYAAEGSPEASLLEDAGVHNGNVQHGHYALQLARSAMCSFRSKPLTYAVKQIRTAVQIHRKFSAEKRATIFLNTVYFGDDQRGIASASQHYFGVAPERLSTPQSALLVGMIRRPTFYSPAKHPDRALARRNQVLEAMKTKGSLSEGDAMAAETSPLGVR